MKTFQHTGTDLTKVEGGAVEKLKASGLDFECEKRPAAYQADLANPGAWTEVPSQFHIVRRDSNRVISQKTVSSGFRVLQNKDAFAWIDDTSIIGDIEIVRGGTFQDGALVFLLGKYPTASVLADGSVVSHYALMTNGHTGNKPLTAAPISIVDKTGALLHGGADGHSIRHTSNMQVNMLDVSRALANFRGLPATFVSLANKLCAKPCTPDQAVEYFMRTIGLDADLLGETQDASSRGDKSKHTRATTAADVYVRLFLAAGGSSFWHAYQSACEYLTFAKSTRIQGVGAKSSTQLATARIQSALYGSSMVLIDKAFALATE